MITVFKAGVISMLLISSAAFAGGKGGGGHTSVTNKPSENMTLNYGKVEHTYSQQTASKKSSAGKSKPQQYMKYDMTDI